MVGASDPLLDAWGVRHLIYSRFASTGEAPAREEIDARTGGRAVELLTDLHERHAIVLDEDGHVRMALPFSAVPTAHRVTAGER
jgi:hypothetical protein